jgi:hypothetical protein
MEKNVFNRYLYHSKKKISIVWDGGGEDKLSHTTATLAISLSNLAKYQRGYRHG